jgi:Flp pilus assembly protein TadD
VLGLLWAADAANGQELGNDVCRACHAGIYRKYALTGMARSSGRAGTGEFRESFDHAGFSDSILGVAYRVSAAPSGYRLEFSRKESGVSGERRLGWFIGSGRVGRSYLFSLDGFLFQSPVSYYTERARWDVSPGFQGSASINLTRAVETGCLQCHASRLQPVAGTQNRYADPPFLQGGISCERCHGAGKEHVSLMTRGNRPKQSGIVNPARLEPARRDSICAQCHLTGTARIARARATGGAWRPGELLTDYSAFFAWSGAGSAPLRVNSHFEELLRSRCKITSGNRLWCGTCHDPHAEPDPVSRAEFYRERCQKCHEPAACKQSEVERRAARDDCTACHMPKSPVQDTEHAVYTDHSIPRRPLDRGQTPAGARELVTLWTTPIDDRDLGLAYAAVCGADVLLRDRALDLLRKAVMRDGKDIPVLAQLAQLEDGAGNEAKAADLDERILRIDPGQVAAAINLATFYYRRGRKREAMQLWTEALQRNPALTAVRINLAVAQYQLGDAATARATLRQALEYDPDQEAARKLLVELRAAEK